MKRKSLVCYCDGGFLLDRKIGGAGVHGYTYDEMSEKPETVSARWIPTKEGYVEKSKGGDSVSILNYIDISKALYEVTSSSQTELSAISEILIWAIAQDESFEKITIITDSENIVMGITKWMVNWKKRDWKGSNGNPVKFVELWKVVDESLEKLRKTTEVTVKWIKGHNGNLGNERADFQATRGIVLARNKDKEIMVNVKDKRGYWNPTPSNPPHRLLIGPRLYTSTYDRKRSSERTCGIYYVGSHGGKERLAEEQGKVYPCNYLSAIRTNEPNPTIGAMSDLILDMEEMRGGTLGTLVTFNLQTLLTGRFCAEVESDGLRFTERKYKPMEVSSSTGQTLAEEIWPIGRGFRLADYCVTLGNILEDIEKGRMIRRQSLLDIFFEESIKKNGVVERKIHKNVGATTKSIKVEGSFSTDKEDVNNVTFKRKIVLILGTDTPPRNTLAALSKDVETFDLVSWRESDNSVRYGTYIKLTTGEDGVWTKYDSNLLLAKL